MGLDALNWYEVAQNQPRWYELFQTISSGGVPRGPWLFCVRLWEDFWLL